MNKVIPDPADYMQDILDTVKYNVVNDTQNITRELTNKVLGYEVGYFGRVDISDTKINYFKSKIDPEILKTSEDKLVKMIEENLEKNITKTLVNDLTRKVIDKVYNDVADRIFTVIHDRITEQVEAKINETLKTWLVAAKFVESGNNEK